MDVKKLLIEQDIYPFFMNIKDENLRKKLFSKCKIIEYKADDFIYHSTKEDNSVFIFLSGRVNIRAFINETTDYIVPWSNKYWYGALSIVADDFTECELFFAEDTKILSFPLKELLFSEPKENYELWMKVGRMAAQALRDIQVKSIKKAALSTEAYFLTLFIENGYHVKNLSIPEIAGRLQVNSRTLQRLVQKLEEKKLIVRNKGKKYIYAVDNNKIDEYLESIV